MRFSKIVLLSAALVAASTPSHADEWRHAIAIYGWGPSVDINATMRGQPVESEDSDFGDIFDNIETAALLRYEGHSEKWGVLGDVVYLGLGYPSVNTAAEVDVDTTVAELAGSWHATEHFEVLFGARYMDVSGDIDFAVLPDVEHSKSWVDALAGIRVTAPLGEHWRWFGRADLAAGGSDLAVNAETAFLWDATEHFSLAAGWRYLSVDYDEGNGADEFALDATFSGAELGFVFRF